MMKAAAVTEYLDEYISFIEEATGITVPETDYRSLRDAVEDGAAARGLVPREYLAALARDAGERESFLNRVTIGETYFFREERHFRALKESVFPMLRARGKKVSIWSATCATGEEAWSLAAFALVHLGLPFTVYATDINSISIDALKKGRYAKNSFREDGSSFREIIMRFASAEGKEVAIGQELRELVRPMRVNLFADALDALPGNIDIIFFRNTLIYMKPLVKARVVERLAGRLAPGGALFLAAPEMPLILNRDLALRESGGAYYFTRAPRPEPAKASRAHDAPAPAPKEYSIPDPSTPAVSIGEGELLRAASLLDEKYYRSSSDRDPVQFVAQLLHYALRFINRASASSAREVIALIERYCEGAATWHLRGLAELTAGNAAGAAKCFRKSLSLDPRFWPARFYLASVMKQTGAHGALEEFRKCRDDIATARGGAVSYRFLLEGFSEKYFLEICDQVLRTQGKKNRDGA